MSSNGNLINYLERNAIKCPHACAVVDENVSWTYGQLRDRSRRIGTALVKAGATRRGVVVLMEKSAQTLAVMMGALYAGSFYVPVDPRIPSTRLERILASLDNPYIVYGDEFPSNLSATDGLRTFTYESLLASDEDESALGYALANHLESDPAYVLFTSGSTGTPKGVAISHHAVECFTDSFTQAFGLSQRDRFANQAPFDFDVSTKDIYGALSLGATLVIVPRPLFMQPVNLVKYLSENEVTVLTWAVAALCIISTYHAFETASLHKVRRILFSGEVMPSKHLAEWRANMPQALFANLYGPTEITCNCLYHILDPDRSYDEGIPLGNPFPHCNVMLVDENGNEVREAGIDGEIVVSGPSVALGYVGMPEVTARSFTQNPLNNLFPERVYRTGDMAAYSDLGELHFRGRKDNQIKLHGHRIELEEIDLAFERHPHVMRCRCVFDVKRQCVRAFYEGSASKQELIAFAREELPSHMRPSSIDLLSVMPVGKNGKIDRRRLLETTQRNNDHRAAV